MLTAVRGTTLKFPPVQQCRQLSWGRPAVAASQPHHVLNLLAQQCSGDARTCQRVEIQ